MDEIIKSYRYRIYPTSEQQKKLEWTFRRCCELYNAALEQRNEAYRKFGITLTNYTQALELKTLKLEEYRPEYKTIDSQVLKNVLARLDMNFKSYFARVKDYKRLGREGYISKYGAKRLEDSRIILDLGKPSFLSSRNYVSITYPNANAKGIQGVKFLDNGKVRLNGIGEVRLKLHTPLEGELRTLNIKRDVNKWYAVFNCRVEAPEFLPSTGLVAGIDLGLKDFITVYDGTASYKVEPLQAYRNAQRKLRIAQRKADRRQGGKGVKSSNRRLKALNIVSVHHQKIREQRKDFHYQTVARLVKDYDVICVENLNIKGMQQGLKLGKSVTDAGMGQFMAILERKCQELGRTLIKVDRFYPSSKTCNKCKHVNPDLTLKDRVWTCPNCKTVLDRDLNAAMNIRSEGISLLTQKVAA